VNVFVCDNYDSFTYNLVSALDAVVISRTSYELDPTVIVTVSPLLTFVSGSGF